MLSTRANQGNDRLGDGALHGCDAGAVRHGAVREHRAQRTSRRRVRGGRQQLGRQDRRYRRRNDLVCDDLCESPRSATHLSANGQRCTPTLLLTHLLYRSLAHSHGTGPVVRDFWAGESHDRHTSVWYSHFGYEQEIAVSGGMITDCDCHQLRM